MLPSSILLAWFFHSRLLILALYDIFDLADIANVFIANSAECGQRYILSTFLLCLVWVGNSCFHSCFNSVVGYRSHINFVYPYLIYILFILKLTCFSKLYRTDSYHSYINKHHGCFDHF
jgi:hypothetical protein